MQTNIALRESDGKIHNKTVDNMADFNKILSDDFSKIISITTDIQNVNAMSLSDLPELQEITFTENVTLQQYALCNCRNLIKIVFHKKAALYATCILGCENLLEMTASPLNLQIK